MPTTKEKQIEDTTATTTESTPLPATVEPEQKYIKERLYDQLDYYSKSSSKNQKCYKRHKLVEIVSAAAIPLLSGMGDSVPYGAWIIGILGASIAISASISALYKYHENWISYRTTLEKLKREKYLYEASVAPYDDTDKFTLLVQRVESIIAEENIQWQEAIAKIDKKGS